VNIRSQEWQQYVPEPFTRWQESRALLLSQAQTNYPFRIRNCVRIKWARRRIIWRGSSATCGYAAGNASQNNFLSFQFQHDQNCTINFIPNLWNLITIYQNCMDDGLHGTRGRTFNFMWIEFGYWRLLLFINLLQNQSRSVVECCFVQMKITLWRNRLLIFFLSSSRTGKLCLIFMNSRIGLRCGFLPFV